MNPIKNELEGIQLSIVYTHFNFLIGTPCSGPIHTGATECLRPHIPDIVEFVADVHTLSKVKSNVRGTSMSLNQVGL